MSNGTSEVLQAEPSFPINEETSLKCISFGCEDKSFSTKSALKYLPCNISVYARAKVVIENTKTSTIVRICVIRHLVTVKHLQTKVVFNVMNGNVMGLNFIPVPSRLANVTKRDSLDRTISLFIKSPTIIFHLLIFQLQTLQSDHPELEDVFQSFSTKTVLKKS